MYPILHLWCSAHELFAQVLDLERVCSPADSADTYTTLLAVNDLAEQITSLSLQDQLPLQPSLCNSPSLACDTHTAWPAADGLAEEFSKLSFQDQHPRDPSVHTITGITNMFQLPQLYRPRSMAKPLSTANSSAVAHPAVILSEHGSDPLRSLWFLDAQLDQRLESILALLDHLSSQEESVQRSVILHMAEEERWLTSTLSVVSEFDAAHDRAGQTLKTAILDRLSAFLDAVGCYLEILQARSCDGCSDSDTPKQINTGTFAANFV